MANPTKTKRDARDRRRRRIRAKVSGTTERPRLSVFRSNQAIYAQVIDDAAGHTLAAATSIEADLRSLSGVAAAEAVGKRAAERAKDRGVERVVFDRGGYLYHGRVKALAEGAREAGLEF